MEGVWLLSAAIIAVVVRVWLIVVLSPASFPFLSRFFILHVSFQVPLDCLIAVSLPLEV